MEFFLNAGLGAGILMFLVLIFKQGKKREDYLFLVWIAVTLLQIVFYQITIYHFELQGLWAILSFALPLLGSPLLFLYILSLTGHKTSWTTIFAHLSIYIIYVVILLVLQQLDDMTLRATNGYFPLPDNAPLWMQYYAIPQAISGLVYCVWDLLLLRRHRKTVAEIFSFDEKINLNWVSYVVYSYLFVFLLGFFLIFGTIHFQLFSFENAFALVGITLSLMLIAFGFYGFRQTAIFSNIDTSNIGNLDIGTSTPEMATYAKSGLTKKKILFYAQQLTEHMDQEKPFLQDDLTLPVLAEQCNLSNVHLSQILNQHFNLNFYNFVNQYRIEESKKMLVSSHYKNLSILGMAYNCGFKSKSSFNRYFKKYNGVSPSVYLERKP